MLQERTFQPYVIADPLALFGPRSSEFGNRVADFGVAFDNEDWTSVAATGENAA